MSKARSYAFTINNPTSDDESQVKALAELAQYVVVGREVGEEGTPHFQGYVYYKNPVAWNSVKVALSRAHVEACGGSPQQNIEYCKKQGEIFLEQGLAPKQGKRSDIERVVEQLKEGANMRTITNTARTMQGVKMAEVWLKYHEECRSWKPEVQWFHGSTGSGKTRTAREWLGDDTYTCLDTIKWWEGYDGHENVLIDDFRKDFCKFHQLLKLLDRYEYKVETKGGSRQVRAKKIAITSPYHPEDIYSTREDVQQLLRRIDKIIQVGERVHRDGCHAHDDDGL